MMLIKPKNTVYNIKKNLYAAICKYEIKYIIIQLYITTNEVGRHICIYVSY